jgi:molecular chaperone GrpE
MTEEKKDEETGTQSAHTAAEPAEEGAAADQDVVAPLEQDPEPAKPSELDAARGEARENYDKFLRAAAELENYKRRAARERSDILKYAGENMARDLLDVLDNLERALLASQTSSGEDFVNGVRLIAEQFKAAFDRHGVRGQSALGTIFDPVKQEALASVPMADKEPGLVLEEFRKSYFFKDKMLRPGQVVVAAKPPEAKAPEEPAAEKVPNGHDGSEGEGEKPAPNVE